MGEGAVRRWAGSAGGAEVTSGARLRRLVAPSGPGRDGAAGALRPPRPRPALGVRGLRARAAREAASHALGPLLGASGGCPLRRAAPRRKRLGVSGVARC